MRKWCALLVCVIACGWIVLAQEKAQLTGDEGKILALENLWIRAERSKNIGALSKIFAPTMVYMGRSSAHARSVPQLPEKRCFLTRSIGERRFEHPLLWQLRRGHRHFPRKVEKGGKVSQIRGRYVDTWAKLNDTWQCVSAQATLIQSH
jgi:hypothetical protein